MSTGLTLWLTGLPCSGKTTIASRVKKALEARHMGRDRGCRVHAVVVEVESLRRDFSRRDGSAQG